MLNLNKKFIKPEWIAISSQVRSKVWRQIDTALLTQIVWVPPVESQFRLEISNNIHDKIKRNFN